MQNTTDYNYVYENPNSGRTFLKNHSDEYMLDWYEGNLYFSTYNKDTGYIGHLVQLDLSDVYAQINPVMLVSILTEKGVKGEPKYLTEAQLILDWVRHDLGLEWKDVD